MNSKCRHCGQPLNFEVINLGHQPPSNAYLTGLDLKKPELSYPLKVYACTSCWLVQVPEYTRADELFTDDYAYFSSTSKTWCEHSKKYVESAIDSKLDQKSYVVNSLKRRLSAPIFAEKEYTLPGIEPTHATAEVARARGIETLEESSGPI